MSTRGAEEREPLARDVDRLAEGALAGEAELDRLEAALDELERRLGEKALAVAEEPSEAAEADLTAATGERAGADDPGPPQRPAPAPAPPPAAAPVPPPPVAGARDPHLEAVAAHVEALGANLAHLRALAANADRKLEALAATVLEDEPARQEEAARALARLIVVIACAMSTVLAWSVVEAIL